MTTLPATLSDACVSICVGPAIRDLVAPLVDGCILTEQYREGAEVVVASFFLPMLAREDRIAGYLGLPEARVRKMGWRLRIAEIWVGENLAPDCYAELFSDEPHRANISLALFAMVAQGYIWGRRDEDGITYSLQRPLPPVHIDGTLCPKCWTTKRYGQTGKCVECARRYMRRYFARPSA